MRRPSLGFGYWQASSHANMFYRYRFFAARNNDKNSKKSQPKSVWFFSKIIWHTLTAASRMAFFRIQPRHWKNSFDSFNKVKKAKGIHLQITKFSQVFMLLRIQWL